MSERPGLLMTLLLQPAEGEAVALVAGALASDEQQYTFAAFTSVLLRRTNAELRGGLAVADERRRGAPA